jgi:hypothetical protein
MQAKFLPEKGMNLFSLLYKDIELLDRHSELDFNHYRAGLGCLIGPHFYLQRKEWIIPVKEREKFPHLAYTDKLGFQDPFSHGIGRYAPWRYQTTETQMKAFLSSQDRWQGSSLGELEGVEFAMEFVATLQQEGLRLHLSVNSKRLSVIGLHYYFALPKGPSEVISDIQPIYNNEGVFHPIPQNWMREGNLCFPLNQKADFGFVPKNHESGQVKLETKTHSLHVQYQGKKDEVSFQLYHPENASFVCIEPMSVLNPRNLNTSHSSLDVLISARTQNSG